MEVAAVVDDAVRWRRHLHVVAFPGLAYVAARRAYRGDARPLLVVAVGSALTVVILVREIGVTLLRLWVLRAGVIPASRGGKVKTAFQMAAIVTSANFSCFSVVT